MTGIDMKNGKIAAKLLTVVAGGMLLAIVVEALASTPLFLNRFNLRTWHRSNIPLAVGPNPVTGGVFKVGRFPFGFGTNTNRVPVYLSTTEGFADKQPRPGRSFSCVREGLPFNPSSS